jgi:hypothetical protein
MSPLRLESGAGTFAGLSAGPAPSRKWRANWACPRAASSSWPPTKIRSALSRRAGRAEERPSGNCTCIRTATRFISSKNWRPSSASAGQPGSGQRLQRHHRIPRPRPDGAGTTWCFAVLFCHLSDRGQTVGRATSSPCRPKITATTCRPCSPSRVGPNSSLWPIPTTPPARSPPPRGCAPPGGRIAGDVVLVMDEAYIEFLDNRWICFR